MASKFLFLKSIPLRRKQLAQIAALITLSALTACSTIPAGPSNTFHYTDSDKEISSTQIQNELTLVSLNLAHGRKDSFSQLLLSENTIRTNLGEVAEYLTARQPDIVALQEADGPSNWSGNFDHVEFLAGQSNFSFSVRTEHVNNYFGNYGTAILSNLPVHDSLGITFSPSPPTTQKGFTLSTVRWKTHHSAPDVLVDVVSLHLDFLSQSVRQQQVAEIKFALQGRNNPLIIMGDFNSEEIARRYLPAHLAEQRGLQIFHLADQLGGSYGNKRLDWVILSDDFEFIEYHIDDVALSDHKPIYVRVRYRAGDGRPAITTDANTNKPHTPITASNGALEEA